MGIGRENEVRTIVPFPWRELLNMSMCCRKAVDRTKRITVKECRNSFSFCRNGGRGSDKESGAALTQAKWVGITRMNDG